MLHLFSRRRGARATTVAGATLHTLTDETSLDRETGAVTSTQRADLIIPAAEIDAVWDPEHLERLARTYWSTLRRFFLGLVYVEYTETERSVVLIFPQVRWRIDRGLLVSRRGRGGDGFLELEVERHDELERGEVRLRIAVEVANFYPALTGISTRLYANTQSRLHVVVCNYFLRRLLRRDLDTSRVGTFAGPRSPAQAPDPPGGVSPAA
jgi:hypothetical protein